MNSYSIDSLHTAYAEVIKFLGITNCYFEEQHKAETILIKPLHIDNPFWIVFSNAVLPRAGRLVIQTDRTSFSLNVSTQVHYFDGDSTMYFKLSFLAHLPEELEIKINDYVSIRDSVEKRCSQRFDLGLEKWSLFGLEKASQILYVEKSQIKCILSNVSLHGVLLTGEVAPFKVGEHLVKLRCNFVHPIENIIQSATITRIEPKTPKFSRYSLRFTEPVSLAWQSRLHSFTKKVIDKEEIYVK